MIAPFKYVVLLVQFAVVQVSNFPTVIRWLPAVHLVHGEAGELILGPVYGEAGAGIRGPLCCDRSLLLAMLASACGRYSCCPASYSGCSRHVDQFPCLSCEPCERSAMESRGRRRSRSVRCASVRITAPGLFSSGIFLDGWIALSGFAKAMEVLCSAGFS